MEVTEFLACVGHRAYTSASCRDGFLVDMCGKYKHIGMRLPPAKPRVIHVIRILRHRNKEGSLTYQESRPTLSSKQNTIQLKCVMGRSRALLQRARSNKLRSLKFCLQGETMCYCQGAKNAHVVTHPYYYLQRATTSVRDEQLILQLIITRLGKRSHCSN